MDSPEFAKESHLKIRLLIFIISIFGLVTTGCLSENAAPPSAVTSPGTEPIPTTPNPQPEIPPTGGGETISDTTTTLATTTTNAPKTTTTVLSVIASGGTTSTTTTTTILSTTTTSTITTTTTVPSTTTTAQPTTTTISSTTTTVPAVVTTTTTPATTTTSTTTSTTQLITTTTLSTTTTQPSNQHGQGSDPNLPVISESDQVPIPQSDSSIYEWNKDAKLCLNDDFEIGYNEFQITSCGHQGGKPVSNLDLSNQNLIGISFKESHLHNINFYGTDLRYSDFRDTVLSRINFDKALLTGSHFDGAKISDSIITDFQTVIMLLDKGAVFESNNLLPKAYTKMMEVLSRIKLDQDSEDSDDDSKSDSEDQDSQDSKDHKGQGTDIKNWSGSSKNKISKLHSAIKSNQAKLKIQREDFLKSWDLYFRSVDSFRQMKYRIMTEKFDIKSTLDERHKVAKDFRDTKIKLIEEPEDSKKPALQKSLVDLLERRKKIAETLKKYLKEKLEKVSEINQAQKEIKTLLEDSESKQKESDDMFEKNQKKRFELLDVITKTLQPK